jgi:hypothetical protein
MLSGLHESANAERCGRPFGGVGKMASEVNDLSLEILRGIRTDMSEMREEIRGIRKALDTLTLRFDDLEQHVDMLRESTMMALGFATNTDIQQKKLEKKVSELTKRVEMLEQAK